MAASLTPATRPGDYAQAVMDLGATICTPRNPACGLCPVNHQCKARNLGIQADLPRKTAKAAKPTRQGTVWIVQRQDGAWLLETRPDRGLLGGMAGWPGNDWDGAGGAVPIEADWKDAGEVRHTFTHFHLILQVLVARPTDQPALRGTFVAGGDFPPGGLAHLDAQGF